MVNKVKLIKVILFIGLIIAVNWGAGFVYTRIDFTKEKKFTLQQKTKELLKDNKHGVTITVFLDGEMPAAFKRLKNATKDILNDYRAYAKGNFKIVFVDPLAGLNAEERDTVIHNLFELGIKPTNVKIKSDAGFAEKLVFPMALIESNGKQMPVKLLQNLGGEASGYEQSINNSIQNLEYIFTSSIKKVISGYNPRIGFTEGNGEPSNAYLYDAISTLSESYVVGRVNLDEITKEGLDSLRVLVIAKPQKAFTEEQKYKLNYFVMKGGSVIWSLDQVRFDLQELADGKPHMAIAHDLNLDDMLFEYGARINYNLIADLNCAEIPVSTPGSPGGDIQLAPWVYYPLLFPDTAQSVVKNIDHVKGEFASTVDTIAVKHVVKHIILTTSPYNKLHNIPKVLSLQELEQQPKPRELSGKPQTVGVLLEGNFKSVFLNRSVPAKITEQFNPAETSKPAKMVVIGDGDIFVNQISNTDGSPFSLGFDRFTQQNYGNKALLLNLVDYLANHDNLIELRNKEVKIRLLDKSLIRKEKIKWQLINTLLPLTLLIFFAIFQHYYRKLKYAK
ncbi:gliding motility-associated ABC transporter substrate-binding protein GldG [Pedobacter montanisoli]|uniref:Gliding motility-associated ABC transporter substrate-binding protein GldG n=1 Tax=Pedobacter montanisoli TaxID=2923277 RepID=A0ABS9ZWC1_9SPHI|nr:gliding motility-associated ABC transporter substrate-binding protein GldG [Pedobacter montanisoli]MCJ0742605.1 gliding motility-associated ABC transporter substrate-binding protein GldG [Pedobacter montanisoli]